MQQTASIRFAILTALFLISVASVYRMFFFTTETDSVQGVPIVGKEGSAHVHASMLIMVEGKRENFCVPKYMLQSPLVHFEDNNCFVVHRHATGVTFPFFFTTIGVKVGNGCMTVPSGTYCNQGNKKVSAVLNRKEIPVAQLASYEMKNNDHLLINYGDETDSQLLFKYNQIPPVPVDINPTKELRELNKKIKEMQQQETPVNANTVPLE